MARRKARWQSSTTPSTLDDRSEDSSKLWHTSSAMSKANRLPNKKGVARARHKHMHDNLSKPKPPTLADRFNALPPELRAHVFSLLIVQPVKWDISHTHHCPRRNSVFAITPEPESGLWRWTGTYVCASCDAPGDLPSRWQTAVRVGVKIFKSPWRSRWAPEQRNPYLCTHCYDELHREKPYPEAKSLPCLCARRQNLDVLLVCKQWYHEAAQVFYTQNTFAFEDPSTFLMFMQTLPQHHRAKISHVSLLALHPQDPGEINVDWRDSSDRRERFQISTKPWAPVWSVLRSLPSLSTLELDSKLLKNEKTTRALLKLGLRNLQRIYFTERPEYTTKLKALYKDGTDKIWPSVACRSLLVGGWAGEVGRVIKGQRRKILKGRPGEELVNDAVGFCLHYGILESRVFQDRGLSKTTARLMHATEVDEYDDEHFGLLGLDD